MGNTIDKPKIGGFKVNENGTKFRGPFGVVFIDDGTKNRGAFGVAPNDDGLIFGGCGISIAGINITYYPDKSVEKTFIIPINLKDFMINGKRFPLKMENVEANGVPA